MTYSVKRLQNEGDCRLTSLQGVESLDVFVSEVNKATRLYIDDLEVFARSDEEPVHDDYFYFKCEIDPDYRSETSQFIMFYGLNMFSLTSVMERVFCLPDSKNERIIGLSGLAEGRNYQKLIFSQEQLQHVLITHEFRSYRFSHFILSPEQSLVLAAKTDLNCLWYCKLEDKGLALIDYLRHRNGTRPLGSFENQFGSAWDNIVIFSRYCTYPVFNELVLDQNNIHHRHSYKNALAAKANVKSVRVVVDPTLFGESDECDPLVEALEDGTFVSPKLHLCFDTNVPVLDEDIGLYRIMLSEMLGAMSSSECRLKELHLELVSAKLSSTVRVFEEHLIDILNYNKSLETLTIDSSAEPLQFPAVSVLKAAEAHPRLRKLVFLPPYGFDPPPIRPTGPFPVWYRNNLSHVIRFDDSVKTRLYEDRRIDSKTHGAKWQDYVFCCRFGLVQQVKDERTRSSLLVAALANHSCSSQRVYFLLKGNQDLFAM